MNLRANYGTIAAAIAAFIGAFWAYQYLSDTVYALDPLIGYGTANLPALRHRSSTPIRVG